jgi:polyphosphate kinase 2 (PPK2 family)
MKKCLAQHPRQMRHGLVVPADDKWFARLTIAAIIYREFEKLEVCLS